MTPTGEYVGRLVAKKGSEVTLQDPRLVMSNEQGMGFGDRIAMTGVQNPKEVVFYNVFFVTETVNEAKTAWQTATSGIITPPKQGIISQVISMCGGVYEEDFDNSQEVTPGTDEQVSKEEEQSTMGSGDRGIMGDLKFTTAGEYMQDSFVYPGSDPQV